MEIRKDIFGKTPKIGDTIVWNPATKSGLVFGTIIDFRKINGLPLIEIDKQFTGRYLGNNAEAGDVYVPKTGFAII